MTVPVDTRTERGCAHGIAGEGCPLCFKGLKVCDFGTCEAPATMLLDFGAEKRRCCDGHRLTMEVTTGRAYRLIAADTKEPF